MTRQMPVPKTPAGSNELWFRSIKICYEQFSTHRICKLISVLLLFLLVVSNLLTLSRTLQMLEKFHDIWTKCCAVLLFCTTTRALHFVAWSISDGSTEAALTTLQRLYFENSICVSKIINCPWIAKSLQQLDRNLAKFHCVVESWNIFQ